MQVHIYKMLSLGVPATQPVSGKVEVDARTTAKVTMFGMLQSLCPALQFEECGVTKGKLRKQRASIAVQRKDTSTTKQK